MEQVTTDVLVVGCAAAAGQAMLQALESAGTVGVRAESVGHAQALLTGHGFGTVVLGLDAMQPEEAREIA